MPAETHQHGDAVTTDDVIELLVACLPEHEDEVRRPDTDLRDLGLDDDMAVLDFWETVTDEHAERSIGEPDLSELLEATTVGELVDAAVRCLRGDGQTHAMSGWETGR